MTLKVAFQMDPIENININEDTTFRIAEEAQKRGHKLFYFLPEQLTFLENDLVCEGYEFTVKRDLDNHFSLSSAMIFPTLSSLRMSLSRVWEAAKINKFSIRLSLMSACFSVASPLMTLATS